MIFEQNAKGERALDFSDGFANRFLRIVGFFVKMIEQCSPDFCVCFGLELIRQIEFIGDRRVVFNDAVMNQRDLTDAVWMGIGSRDTAVSCPARMADAAGRRVHFVTDRAQVLHLARCLS